MLAGTHAVQPSVPFTMVPQLLPRLLATLAMLPFSQPVPNHSAAPSSTLWGAPAQAAAIKPPVRGAGGQAGKPVQANNPTTLLTVPALAASKHAIHAEAAMQLHARQHKRYALH